MPNIICTSDYTISDFNDAISLSGYIGSNLAHTQIYSPDNGGYTPDWSSTNLVLTPQLYVTSTTTDVIATSAVQTVSWYLNSETSGNKIITGGDYALSGTKSHILTVKNNVLAGLNNIKFICVILYHDSTTDLDLTHKMDVTFTKVSSGSGIADAICVAEQGNIFKNSEVANLTASCDLWRGSTIDTTNVSYQWYIRDPSVATDQGGGVGWKKLSNTTNVYTGVTTRLITIYPDAVPNVATFKCVIKDTDSTSDTYNGEFYDTITFTDLSDPIQCTIVSSGGDTFVNGNGSSILTARLFRGGAEIDATSPYTYTYKWYKYDKDSNLVTGWGGSTDYKTGKTLSIGSSDVDVKATFRVEVE